MEAYDLNEEALDIPSSFTKTGPQATSTSSKDPRASDTKRKEVRFSERDEQREFEFSDRDEQREVEFSERDEQREVEFSECDGKDDDDSSAGKLTLDVILQMADVVPRVPIQAERKVGGKSYYTV